MARSACKAYGYELSEKVEDEFRYRTTHNDGVFRVYGEDMRKVRHAGIITGLPDAYGRGRIIGDYRRVALYGVDRLIEEKKKDKAEIILGLMDAETIKLSEELYEQIEFLEKLKAMAQMYGEDISRPAENFREAMQWVYFAYLAANKEQNGAAMSLGRVSTFLDIYAERDLKNGVLTESGVQEIVDHFVIKLRGMRHLRTPEYNELFGGDPMWITESVGGMGENGVTLVTKNSFRFLHTLYNLGSAPEPNLTVLWSEKLPEAFKKYAAKVSAETDSIQYENDDLMREEGGDDYAIACCVSRMKIGKQMQYLRRAVQLGENPFNGAQRRQGRALFHADRPAKCPFTRAKRWNTARSWSVSISISKWLAKTYVNTMNVIHFMHDKYAYEKLQMALHDTRRRAADGVRRGGAERARGLAFRDTVRQSETRQKRARHHRGLR